MQNEYKRFYSWSNSFYIIDVCFIRLSIIKWNVLGRYALMWPYNDDEAEFLNGKTKRKI